MAEPFLTLTQRSVSLFVICYVEAHSDHLHRPSGCVAQHVAHGIKQAHRVIRADDPVLMLKAFLIGARSIDCFCSGLPIIWMDPLNEGLKRSIKLLRPQAIDMVQLIRPGDRIGREVPVPTAQMGELLCPGQLELTPLEHFLGPDTPHNVSKLGPDVSHDLQKGLVRFYGLGGKELQHSQNFSPHHHGESKSGFHASVLNRIGAQKIRVLGHVYDPGRFASGLDTPRQSLAGRERSCRRRLLERLELFRVVEVP